MSLLPSEEERAVELTLLFYLTLATPADGWIDASLRHPQGFPQGHLAFLIGSGDGWPGKGVSVNVYVREDEEEGPI